MNQDRSYTRSLRPLRVGELLDLSLVMILHMLPGLLPVVVFIALSEQASVILPQDYAILHVLFAVLSYALPFVLQLVVTMAASSYRIHGSSGIARAFRQFPLRRFVGSICMTIWISIVTVFLCLFLVFPGIIYTVNRMLAVTIYIVEGQSMSDSLWRSKFLMTQGRWYSPSSPIMRVSVVLFVLFVVVSSLSLRYGVTEYFGWGETVSSIGALIIEVIFGAFTQLLTGFAAIVYVNFYYDLRSRYEGLDLLVGLEELEASIPGPVHA